MDAASGHNVIVFWEYDKPEMIFKSLEPFVYKFYKIGGWKISFRNNANSKWSNKRNEKNYSKIYVCFLSEKIRNVKKRDPNLNLVLVELITLKLLAYAR